MLTRSFDHALTLAAEILGKNVVPFTPFFNIKGNNYYNSLVVLSLMHSFMTRLSLKQILGMVLESFSALYIMQESK